jgi:hypothetical protein
VITWGILVGTQAKVTLGAAGGQVTTSKDVTTCPGWVETLGVKLVSRLFVVTTSVLVKVGVATHDMIEI